MALYADNGSGAPGALKTESSAMALATGSNVFPVSSVTLAPATYWIAAEFNANASICNDGSKGHLGPVRDEHLSIFAESASVPRRTKRAIRTSTFMSSRPE